MDSPVNGVLETYELLELVLLALPMQDLFVAQRVNKAWKTIIERSEALQKKMFLLADGKPLTPTPNKLGSTFDPEYRHTLRLPPAVSVFCLGEKHSVESDRKYNDSDEDNLPGVYCLYGMPEPGAVAMTFEVSPLYDYEAREQPVYGWRKLLMTQPPITAVTLQAQLQSESMTYDPAIECTVYNVAGLTLGDVYDLCGALRRQSLEHACTAFDEVYLQFTMTSKLVKQGKANGDDAEGERSLGDCTCDVISDLIAE